MEPQTADGSATAAAAAAAASSGKRAWKGKKGDWARGAARRTPGMTTSFVASKQRSVGTPPRPVTPPQLVRRMDSLTWKEEVGGRR